MYILEREEELRKCKENVAFTPGLRVKHTPASRYKYSASYRDATAVIEKNHGTTVLINYGDLNGQRLGSYNINIKDLAIIPEDKAKSEKLAKKKPILTIGMTHADERYDNGMKTLRISEKFHDTFTAEASKAIRSSGEILDYLIGMNNDGVIDGLAKVEKCGGCGSHSQINQDQISIGTLQLVTQDCVWCGMGRINASELMRSDAHARELYKMLNKEIYIISIDYMGELVVSRTNMENYATGEYMAYGIVPMKRKKYTAVADNWKMNSEEDTRKRSEEGLKKTLVKARRKKLDSIHDAMRPGMHIAPGVIRHMEGYTREQLIVDSVNEVGEIPLQPTYGDSLIVPQQLEAQARVLTTEGRMKAVARSRRTGRVRRRAGIKLTGGINPIPPEGFVSDSFTASSSPSDSSG